MLLNSLLLAVVIIIIVLIGFIYLAPETATRLTLRAERSRSGLTRKKIELPDGLHYTYLEGGQGEPLMLLHGFGGNKDTFTRVARFLVHRYRVIIPDIIGFAESAHPAQADYAPPAQAERLRALSQALGLEDLHIGGNSMGGQIAMTYAALYPAEVKSLWLLSPSGVWNAPQSNLLKAFAETERNPLIAKNISEFKQVMALGINKPPFIPRPMLGVLAQERINNVALEERIFQEIIEHSVEKQISGMKIPTLIVFGELDRVIPIKTAEVLHKLLPCSQVIIMPDAGHVSMFDQPRQSAADYLMFRASLSEQAAVR